MNTADRARIKMMLGKLKDLSARGHISDKWAEDFVWSLDEQVEFGKDPSEKQVNKLEEIFERA